MSEIKLKPCRCGGDATIVEEKDGKQRYFYVKCCECGDMTWLYSSELNAVEAWNRWECEQDVRE